jgi:general secretion pathway protein A
MYKEYFHLTEMPFSIAPDPRFLFMSERHCDAMAHLMYGVKGEGGIVLLTGEVGTGKTTLCRSLIELLPNGVDIAFVLNPRMNAVELLQTICEEFHIEVAHAAPGIKTYVDALNARLLANHALGHRAILIVDEAQNLSAEVLEQ